MEIDYEKLIAEAIEARKNAYVPYSKFGVGAALLTADGTIYRGCNIENGAYGSTICAERTAFCKAISEGQRDFVALGIVAGPVDGELRPVCEPCGACRQFMAEFCKGDFKLAFGSGTSPITVFTLDEMLPHRFEL